MKFATLFMGLTVMALASEAQAQSSGALRVSVERVFGFAYSALTSSSSRTMGSTTITEESTSTWTSINLFGASAHAFTPALLTVPAGQPPRFGVDYELGAHVTLGGAAFLSFNSVSSADDRSTSLVGFGVAPRVGYVIAFNERWSLWPRVGVTFSHMSASLPTTVSASSTTESSLTYTSLTVNVEPTLTFMPTTHFGLTAALVVDIPATGNLTSTTRVTRGGMATETVREVTATQLLLGLQFGVLGRF